MDHGIASNEEGWVGQIKLDGVWMDYARGYEAETKAWQAAKPDTRRIKHWITGEIIVNSTEKEGN